MSAKAASLCCPHPRQQIDSPEPPSRPIATIDGIFAAAALPEDHPHALKFPERKPELHASILRSPGITSKIKLQFQRRRSKMSLGKEKRYDLDAREMTPQEALKDAEELRSDGFAADAVGLARLGSLAPSGDDECVTRSVTRSIGYLKPVVQQPSDVTEDHVVDGIVELAKAVASSPRNTASWNDRPVPAIPKSISLPLLPQEDGQASISPRESRSDSVLRDSTTVAPIPEARPSHASSPTTASENQPAISPGIQQWDIPTLDICEATNDSISIPIVAKSSTEPKSMPSEDSLHLEKMAISQQLRSMSQLSDVAEDDMHKASTDLWTFHRRERSDIGSNIKSGRRTRYTSGSGMDSTTVPSVWGRVRSPMPDNASSIYSRPTSAGESGTHNLGDTPDQEPRVPMVDLHALFSDWPLKTSASVESTGPSLADGHRTSGEAEGRNKSLPPTPNESRNDSGLASFVTAATDAEQASVRWLSLPQRAASVLSENSSTLTKTSKHSKFLERLSPPKKTVKKRRSLFKFLRPGSRKQQGRSISTPTLTSRAPMTLVSFDGQSEDPALLTVQYELDEVPNQTRRAVSMKNLLTASNADMSSQSQKARTLERRPTLADYERNLSVAGDDRRRPSTINIEKFKEVQTDDHRASVGIRRRLSRARPLKDDASPLMAQALEKHQQEKALFRSPSKQRESLKSSARTAPVFKSSPFSSFNLTADDDSEPTFDPLDKGKAPAMMQRSRSSTYLLLPGATAAPQPAQMRPTVGQSSAADSIPLAKKRIGTSLESWSRYPSHTRTERCGSAGRPDNVITRDFAVDVNHADIQVTDDIEAASPDSKRTQKSKRSKNTLPKSRSMTFSSTVKYYQNLFSSTSVGQNRRTSVAIGGRLEYPELELLPDQLAAEPLVQPPHKHSGAFHRFKEHAKADADRIKEFVKEEEEKVEEYMKEEESKFETFVRREEELFEGFVKKEEGKFKDYVKVEEDNFKQHWHHHSSGHSRDSPFRETSLFEPEHEHKQEAKTQKKDSLSIGPMDDAEDIPAVITDSATATGLRLDGASTISTLDERKSSSKAELWSEVYRECLARPSSAGKNEERQPTTPGISMPPQSPLKPAKARSPEQTGSEATIRRFPSVTVIDDRKGHFRSISLISVKTAREQRKRDNQLFGVQRALSTQALK